jgi:hypothetical protein
MLPDVSPNRILRGIVKLRRYGQTSLMIFQTPGYLSGSHQ